VGAIAQLGKAGIRKTLFCAAERQTGSLAGAMRQDDTLYSFTSLQQVKSFKGL
jgi:hypothetical protein